MNENKIGKIVIRPGNENQEPRVVYVGGVNSFGVLVCKVLNTGDILFSDPEKDSLLDFDMDTFELLKKEWKIKNLRKQLNELEKVT